MTTLTNEQIEKMNKGELHKAAKARSIKYGKLSVMQVREALKANPDVPKPAAKAKRVPPKRKDDGKPSKMDKAVEIMKANPKLVRKDIIALFMSDAGLTKAGASTYYQLVQKKLK